MSVYGNPYAYTKMGMEDPEEMKHRKAQFLIYKSLERAGSSMRKSRRPSWLRVRIFKLKIKFGKKLKKLKKSLLIARVGVAQQWKILLCVRQAMAKLPPLFS